MYEIAFFGLFIMCILGLVAFLFFMISIFRPYRR
jgi:hypothetical protein